MAWFCATVVTNMRAVGMQAGAQAVAQPQALHVGYHAYLAAARLVLNLFLDGADTLFAMPHEALNAACAFLEDAFLMLQEGSPGYKLIMESSIMKRAQLLADNIPTFLRVANSPQWGASVSIAHKPVTFSMVGG